MKITWHNILQSSFLNVTGENKIVKMISLGYSHLIYPSKNVTSIFTANRIVRNFFILNHKMKIYSQIKRTRTFLVLNFKMNRFSQIKKNAK